MNEYFSTIRSCSFYYETPTTNNFLKNEPQSDQWTIVEERKDGWSLTCRIHAQSHKISQVASEKRLRHLKCVNKKLKCNGEREQVIPTHDSELPIWLKIVKFLSPCIFDLKNDVMHLHVLSPLFLRIFFLFSLSLGETTSLHSMAALKSLQQSRARQPPRSFLHRPRRSTIS